MIRAPLTSKTVKIDRKTQRMKHLDCGNDLIPSRPLNLEHLNHERQRDTLFN